MSEKDLRELADRYMIPLPLVIALSKALGDRLEDFLRTIDGREVGY